MFLNEICCFSNAWTIQRVRGRWVLKLITWCCAFSWQLIQFLFGQLPPGPSSSGIKRKMWVPVRDHHPHKKKPPPKSQAQRGPWVQVTWPSHPGDKRWMDLLSQICWPLAFRILCTKCPLSSWDYCGGREREKKKKELASQQTKCPAKKYRRYSYEHVEGIYSVYNGTTLRRWHRLHDVS